LDTGGRNLSFRPRTTSILHRRYLSAIDRCSNAARPPRLEGPGRGSRAHGPGPRGGLRYGRLPRLPSRPLFQQPESAAVLQLRARRADIDPISRQSPTDIAAVPAHPEFHRGLADQGFHVESRRASPPDAKAWPNRGIIRPTGKTQAGCTAGQPRHSSHGQLPLKVYPVRLHITAGGADLLSSNDRA